jgi:coenzyme F420-0:L-glutamate ligase/coenzyme F420-1:gamma-L-glutamate ligase
MTKDDLHAFLRSRRSIRHFKPDPIPSDILQRVIETATYAPSSHNLQPWRFAVLTHAEAKSRLAEAITARLRQDMTAEGVPEADIQARIKRSIHRAHEAPVVVVLCRDTIKVNPQPDALRQQAEAMMGTQSVALAGLQLLLAAHAEGLGGTWICWPLFAPDETRYILGLPAEWEPQGMIFLGYPNEAPETPERRPLQKVTRYL